MSENFCSSNPINESEAYSLSIEPLNAPKNSLEKNLAI